ncbi:MAG: DUF1499 domain-containing protein [Nitrospinales bacterium]
MLKKLNKKISVLICSLAFLPACSGTRPGNIGVNDGKLLDCPDSPNCVSSFALDEKHQIDPLSYSGSSEEQIKVLKTIISNFGNASIVSENENYIHAEFASKMFKFVDDVEFFLDEKNKTIHFRSASRLGYGDFGVNRKRIEAIKTTLSGKSR